MKEKISAIIFSFILPYSVAFQAQGQPETSQQTTANPVADHAVSSTLEPYKKVHLKFENMNKAQRKTYLAEIKNKWSSSSAEEKQKIKQQIKSQLKQAKHDLQQKEQNT